MATAHAQTAAWPSKPISIVVTYPPGGGADTMARLLAPKLGEALGGASVIVENKPGAAGNIAMQEVANSTDEHTMILGHIGTLASQPVYF